MKKIYVLIFLLIAIFMFMLLTYKDNKKKSKDLDTIKLAEVTHSVFYTPLYVAIENNYFRENKIDIDLILTSGADKVSAAVLSKDVNIGFAGLESAMYVYEGGEKDYLKAFSGLTKRDGQFIVGRVNSYNFSLEDLKGKEILVGRKGGMPALNFINALKNEGIDINDVNINYQIDFASLGGAFIGGTGDYVNLFEPTVTLLSKDANLYNLLPIGKYSGEMPYTVFYARKSFIEKNKDLINRFNDAIDKGLEYTLNNNSKDIAKVISSQFPDISINDLTKMIDNYKNADSWISNHNISKSSYNNLEQLLISNNLIKNPIPFNKIVVNE